MNKIIKLIPVLITPLLLNSCGNSETYDFKKPSSSEVDSLTIPLQDGSTLSVNKDTDFNSFRGLKNYSYNQSNCDISFHASFDTGDKVEANCQIRNTNKDDKHGYYKLVESKGVSFKEAAYSAEGISYAGFSYYKKKSNLIALNGTVISASEAETINASKGKTIVDADPDYEPGTYTKDGIPSIPDNVYDDNGLFSISVFNKAISEYDCYHVNSLFNIRSNSEPTRSFKMTKDYLILEVKNPSGLFNLGVILGRDIDVIVAQAEAAGCYTNTTLYYDVNDGELAYCEAKFKTNNLSAAYRLRIVEGSLIMKAKKESDEGYNNFMSVRKEVMTTQNKHN